MDYSEAVFGIMRPGSADAAAQRDVDYKKPPPAREGFTRSPTSTDMLICADCEAELGVKIPEAGEDDRSDEVWVAMKCGHVSYSRWIGCLGGFIGFTDNDNRSIVGIVFNLTSQKMLRLYQANVQGLNRNLVVYRSVRAIFLQKQDCLRFISK